MHGKSMNTGRLKGSKVDVESNLDALFAMEHEIARATPSLLQLGTKEKLFEFLTGEHGSGTWLWADQKGVNVGYLTLIDKPKEENWKSSQSASCRAIRTAVMESR